MSTLKYDAVGFCSDWRRNRSVKAGILNSNVVLILVDCSLSLKFWGKFDFGIRSSNLIETYTLINCLFGKILSRFCTFLMRKHSLAGFGLFAKTFTIPAGNDSIMSPDIFTWHLVSSLPLKEWKSLWKGPGEKLHQTHLKNAWIISWNATARGTVSLMPIVSGDGPLLEPIPAAVLNSRLPTLSARAIAGLTLPRTSNEMRR